MPLSGSCSPGLAEVQVLLQLPSSMLANKGIPLFRLVVVSSIASLVVVVVVVVQSHVDNSFSFAFDTW